MNYAIDMGCDALMSILSVIKVGSGSQELLGGYAYRHRQQSDLVSLILFFVTKEGSLKIANKSFINVKKF
jgi:hypothetical protein